MDAEPISAKRKQFDDPVIKFNEIWSGNLSENHYLFDYKEINNTQYNDVYYFSIDPMDHNNLSRVFYNHKYGIVG